MGRVYEALKRAAHADAKPNSAADATAPHVEPANGHHANGNGASHRAAPEPAHTNGRPVPVADPLFNQPASYFHAPEAAHNSASTEHTAQAQVGSALPG